MLYEAVVNSAATHSGDPRLARDVGNATVLTDNRGTRIYEEHKHSTRRIDLAVCAIMAHSVAPPSTPGCWAFRVCVRTGIPTIL